MAPLPSKVVAFTLTQSGATSRCLGDGDRHVALALAQLDHVGEHRAIDVDNLVAQFAHHRRYLDQKLLARARPSTARRCRENARRCRPTPPPPGWRRRSRVPPRRRRSDRRARLASSKWTHPSINGRPAATACTSYPIPVRIMSVHSVLRLLRMASAIATSSRNVTLILVRSPGTVNTGSPSASTSDPSSLDLKSACARFAVCAQDQVRVETPAASARPRRARDR